MKRTAAGFTIIELMVVVAIVAVLMAIAIPSFQDYIRRGRRADAVACLQQLQLAQERYRSNNPTYGTTAQLSYTSTSPFYTCAVTGTPTGTNYTLTATRIGAQTSDSTCGDYSLSQAARTGAGATGVTITKSPDPATTACWR